jgi:flavin reductase (DIM6/NTAB) family NADH-FMN oxidoreductase RutF
VNVPTIDDSHWLYECEITKIIELEGSHLFLADIKNIQIDKQYENMNMERIDLRELRPAIYSPYNYFSIGEKLGNVGEWKKHLKE